MTVEEFLKRLDKPRYVYMMAKPNTKPKTVLVGQPRESSIKSARTRVMNAEQEIRDLIEQFYKENNPV